MRRLHIELPKRVYGLVLGSFCLGVQLTKVGKRTSFSLVATKIMRDPYTLYGVFLGKIFYGWGDVPRYTRSEIKNALVEIALAKNPPTGLTLTRPVDQSSITDVIKYDMRQDIPAESVKKAEEFLDGKLELSKLTNLSYDVLNTKHNQISKAATSDATLRSRKNYYKRNVANHVVRSEKSPDKPLYNVQPEKIEDLTKEAFPQGKPE